jgi:hypothetical protein
MRTGFFAYPWDMLDEGPEAAVQAMASRYHCNTLILNASYHHARLLRPRAAGPKTLELPGAVAAFEPRAECYGDSELMPIPDPSLAHSRIVQTTREACAAQGLDFGLWVVGLHNSTLGQAHPDLCMRNCFDDVYPYALCPSQPAVQAYLCGLAQDLSGQFHPQRIVLEAVGYLSLRHWVHHELFMTPWNEALEFLFSLCFCPACMGRARQRGVDVPALRRQVSQWTNYLLNEERGDLAPDFSLGETAALLLHLRDLPLYMRSASESVTELVASVHAVTRRYGVELEVIPASFHRPVSRAWMEGASLPDLGGVSEGLVVLAYSDQPAQVAADLGWAAQSAPGRRIIAGLSACAPTLHAASVLAAQTSTCRAAGCAAVYYYNYGLLASGRLEWVGQANLAVGSSEVKP